MARKSFAESIAKTQLLVKGLQGRNEALPVGITAELVAEVEKLNQQAVDLNATQEKLKAELKEKTAQLDSVMKTLEQKHSTAKKYIKLAIAKELWREFGIDDKR